jgi:hypothetical protein
MVDYRAKRLASGFCGNSVNIRQCQCVIHAGSVGRSVPLSDKNFRRYPVKLTQERYSWGPCVVSDPGAARRAA